MSQAITLVDIKSAKIPAGTRVKLMSEDNHDPETGRLRISYNGSYYLVPERMISVLQD